MSDEFFVLGLAISFALLLRWAFKTLPAERWQIMASIPVAKAGTNKWKGLNLTYYGLFIASATAMSVTILVVLLAAIQVRPAATMVLVGLVFALCFPAAKVVARLVEKKPHTLTIAGASFLGIIAAPFAVRLADFVCGPTAGQVAVIPALASISIAYGLGEGLGRLACISFGCCYGKPLSQCGLWIQRAFNRYAFVFSGETKKIAYEGELDGVNVVPIQAVTSMLYIAVSLAGILLYLKSHYSTALILVVVATQAWRALSETLRADHRGGGSITAYQIMALLAIGYVFLLVGMLGSEPLPTADLKAGLASLWDPAVLILVQLAGLASFLYTGRSMVTESLMSFHIVKDRI
jgi:hypothetical protein